MVALLLEIFTFFFLFFSPHSSMRSQHPELASPEKRRFLLFGHPCRLFLGPEFRLAARWNRLVETVKTRKKWGKTGKKWARYGLKRVKVGS